MTDTPTSAWAPRLTADRRGSNLGNYDLLHGQTPSQTLGPFFAQGLARTRTAFQLPHLCSDERDVIGNVLATDATPGERLRLEGVVYDGLGVPVTDALIEIWQADAEGRYAHELDPRGRDAAFQGFGRAPTDGSGRFSFETIKPGRVPAFGGGVQAPHINLLLGARGMTQIAFTRVYFPEDAELATDAVLVRVPSGRRSTLIARRADAAGRRMYRFDLRLQGDRETVFFDF
jgi:protocatechuate 3,4-dioxygenase alpha subunit